MVIKSIEPLPRHLNNFLEYCEVEKGLTPLTAKNYARFLKRFFSWLEKENLSSLTPDELSEEHVTKYRIWISRLPNATRASASGLSSSTQIRYLIALRSFLSYFHEKGIPCLPTEKIKLPKERKERHVKFLDFEQVQKLVGTAGNTTPAGLRDRAILEGLFSTGLRVAELAALDKKQFDTLSKKKDFEISIVGKGGYPRTVYFSENSFTALKAYLATRGDSDPALFIRYGGPKHARLRLTTYAIETIVKKYAVRAGLPFLATPHTLRHSFATDLLNQGVDLRSVQEFLGHRNIATTQVYTHVTNKQLRDIHRKVHSQRHNKSE